LSFHCLSITSHYGQASERVFSPITNDTLQGFDFFARIKTLKAVLDVDKLQQKGFLPQPVAVITAKPLDAVGSDLYLIRAGDRNIHNFSATAGFD
jgi:hypothetical protein